MNQSKIEGGWRIEVVIAHKAWTEKNSGFPLSEASYLLTNSSTNRIEYINGKFDENETIIFHDINNDELMNAGDFFIINENSENHVKSGYNFGIITSSAWDAVKLE